ncbi:MAG: 50S ribosomal protein L32 [Candidatus Marinimicrobia bacterium]|nr:50S ribosomal protein L32 [Candidatus Neomarinimicrobiota bacterium]
MALPKRRQSKSRGRKRRTHYKSSPANTVKCKVTGEVHVRHRAYYHNGVLYYKGKPLGSES